jgi:hypothetical protein
MWMIRPTRILHTPSRLHLPHLFDIDYESKSEIKLTFNMDGLVVNRLWMAHGRARENEDCEEKRSRSKHRHRRYVEPDFGWPIHDHSVRRSCWIVRPSIHPVTIVIIVLLVLCVFVFGFLGCFLVILVLFCALYKFYI